MKLGPLPAVIYMLLSLLTESVFISICIFSFRLVDAIKSADGGAGWAKAASVLIGIEVAWLIWVRFPLRM